MQSSFRNGGRTALAALAIGVVISTSASARKPVSDVPADHAEKMAQGLVLFKEKVRPLLIAQCLDCHGGKSKKGDFDLSDRKLLVDSGVIEGGGRASQLYQLVTHAEEPYMPHKKPKLPQADADILALWIDLGAPYDRPLIDKGEVAKATEKKPSGSTEDDRAFWSFRALAIVAPPSLKNAGWVRTPIDRFVLAKLEGKGLSPNPVVERRTLIRRVSFDLIGLPPTPEEVEAFVSDTRPDAYDRLVERLLESPHHGERWARHWMDIARFAESHGYEQDYDRPFAYHYRDFLIKAFNKDMPYDQFMRWQVAGDDKRRLRGVICPACDRDRSPGWSQSRGGFGDRQRCRPGRVRAAVRFQRVQPGGVQQLPLQHRAGLHPHWRYGAQRSVGALEA